MAGVRRAALAAAPLAAAGARRGLGRPPPPRGAWVAAAAGGGSSLQARRVATNADLLRPLEEGIAAGLRGRLSLLEQSGLLLQLGAAEAEGPQQPAPRVAVAGRHSAELIAAARAVRATGASVATVDTGGRDAEEVVARLAEAQVHMAVIAGATEREEGVVKEAARFVGTSAASTAALYYEGTSGAGLPAASAQPQGSAVPPALLFSALPRSGSPCAAEVPAHALDARVADAVDLWGFTGDDVVLPLGLQADAPAALIDAAEAPLSVGAAVAAPPLPSASAASSTRGAGAGRPAAAAALSPWDLWQALREQHDATVLFLGADRCWSLLDSHQQLDPRVRADLGARWRRKPLRHMVALARSGSTPSQELSRRWAEIFHGPLTWYFTCAEAGPLYTAQVATEGSFEAGLLGRCPSSLQWRVDAEGELWVSSRGLFERYRDRPRSTREVFDEGGTFCRTGHRVQVHHGGAALLPVPARVDLEEEREVEQHLHWGPKKEGWPRMAPDWRVRKVWMKKWEIWRTAANSVFPTKKHNQAHKIYQGKYK